MRVEVRSIKTLRIVPETDADRAVLVAMLDMRDDPTKFFHIQSDTWADGLREICIGFDTVAQS